MSSSWDEYLESEEYIDGLVTERDEIEQRNLIFVWYKRLDEFWDWRLA